MKDLRQITVIGLGLLGGLITLAILRRFPEVKVVGYTHRASTRQRARRLSVATEIANNIHRSVLEADLVILATPISTFVNILSQISKSLPAGCIVTDIGSTKALPHQWAAKMLPKSIHYVGSHPVAGSEQRGIEFAREDLFEKSICIITKTEKTNSKATQILKKFWSMLGCDVKFMTPKEHDRIFATISHLPHVVAATLINSNKSDVLKYAGKGFIDTTRLASGSANIWSDVLVTNTNNATKGIDKIINELKKIKKAIKGHNKKQIENLLAKARDKRSELIKYKINIKEII